uniref:Uncharacterized protein n=1 Tax=Arundo donax TaxID=35708 RepID=A0A0A9ANW7_ARUDO
MSGCHDVNKVIN